MDIPKDINLTPLNCFIDNKKFKIYNTQCFSLIFIFTNFIFIYS